MCKILNVVVIWINVMGKNVINDLLQINNAALLIQKNYFSYNFGVVSH